MATDDAERLAAIEAAFEAATPGPWTYRRIVETDGDFHFVVGVDETVIGSADEAVDAILFAAAPDDVRWLLAALRAANERVAAAEAESVLLKEALAAISPGVEVMFWDSIPQHLHAVLKANGY